MEFAGINITDMAQTFGEASIALSKFVKRKKTKKRRAK